MMSVPKRANDAIHLSLLEGLEVNINTQFAFLFFYLNLIYDEKAQQTKQVTTFNPLTTILAKNIILKALHLNVDLQKINCSCL